MYIYIGAGAGALIIIIILILALKPKKKKVMPNQAYNKNYRPNNPMNNIPNNPMISMPNNPMNAQINNPVNNPINAPFSNPMGVPVNNQVNAQGNNPISTPMNNQINNQMKAPRSVPINTPVNSSPQGPINNSMNIPPANGPSDEQKTVAQNNFSKQQIIYCTSGYYSDKFFSLNNGSLIIGRDYRVCNIVFPDNTAGVSSIHCEISYDPALGKCVLIDKGSRYGTFLGNGEELVPGKVYYLSILDSFYLASTENMFEIREI